LKRLIRGRAHASVCRSSDDGTTVVNKENPMVGGAWMLQSMLQAGGEP
jgi:hypothetical protein